MKNRLKQLREERHLSQEKLASKVGLTGSSIVFFETGKREPKPETWQKLADFFDVSVPYLKGEITYKALDPAEKGVYNYVTVAMDRAFNEYAVLPETREKILKTIAYSIENGEFI